MREIEQEMKSKLERQSLVTEWAALDFEGVE